MKTLMIVISVLFCSLNRIFSETPDTISLNFNKFNEIGIVQLA